MKSDWDKILVWGIYGVWRKGDELWIESIVSGACQGKATVQANNVVWTDDDKLPEGLKSAIVETVNRD